MPDQERRKYRRLDIRLPLECYRLDDDAENTYRTVTLNVSTGGICFGTDADDLEPGALLHVELTPPTDPGAPLLVQLFMAPAAPPSAARAVFGLLALTAVVLWVAARSVRRLEINYSTE